MRPLNFRVYSYYDKRYLPLVVKDSEIYINAFGQVRYNKQIDNLPCLPQDELRIELFTGFYDKNKKQIYEGDILKCWNDNYYESKDDPYASGSIAIPLAEHEKTFDFFAIQFDEDLGFASKDLLTLSYIIVNYDCVEVVGNIHENPDLHN